MKIFLQVIVSVLLLTSVLTVSIKKEHSKFTLRGAESAKLALPSLVGVDDSAEQAAVAVLAARKKTTGIVANIGENGFSVVPVVDSTPVSNAIVTAPYGGKDVTEYLRSLLKKIGYDFTSDAEKRVVKNIKETLCYVAEDFDDMRNQAESTSAFERNYELPDEQVITIGKERFVAPELLFKPALFGFENDGIDKLIYESIMKTDREVRGGLFSNIVLTGGPNVFPGMRERVLKEIKALAPPFSTVKVFDK